MPESVPKDKEMIYPAKLSISGSVTQTMSSSKISAGGSISREKDLRPYWTDSCLTMSKKLLSLTRTDSADSDSSCWSNLQVSSTQNSWFSGIQSSPLKKNLYRTLFPSSILSPAEFTDSGNILVRSKKIRIYPKLESQNRIKRFCGLSRYWFNKAIDYLKTPGTKASLIEVRKIQKDLHPEWAMDCPQRIREFAMKDACIAVKNAKTKFRKTATCNEVKYRSRKNTTQGFGFDQQSLGEDFVFRTHTIEFKTTESFASELGGTKVVKENGRWFLTIPRTVNIKMPENQRLGVVALDPGVRTFQTYYSPFASGKVGCHDFSRVFRLCYRLDKVYSKMSIADYKGGRRLKKASQKLRWKIRDLIDDLHNKFAYFLVTNFEHIIIPTFETSGMVSKLHSKTARSMLTWAHYRFKQKLINKAEEYSAKVYEVNEAFTSKTCSYCGRIQNIGSKGIFKCKCGVEVDRDLNGARGIFLRTLSENLPDVAGFRLPEFDQVVNLSNFVRNC